MSDDLSQVSAYSFDYPPPGPAPPVGDDTKSDRKSIDNGALWHERANRLHQDDFDGRGTHSAKPLPPASSESALACDRVVLTMTLTNYRCRYTEVGARWDMDADPETRPHRDILPSPSLVNAAAPFALFPVIRTVLSMFFCRP